MALDMILKPCIMIFNRTKFNWKELKFLGLVLVLICSVLLVLGQGLALQSRQGLTDSNPAWASVLG